MQLVGGEEGDGKTLAVQAVQKGLVAIEVLLLPLPSLLPLPLPLVTLLLITSTTTVITTDLKLLLSPTLTHYY